MSGNIFDGFEDLDVGQTADKLKIKRTPGMDEGILKVLNSNYSNNYNYTILEPGTKIRELETGNDYTIISSHENISKIKEFIISKKGKETKVVCISELKKDFVVKKEFLPKQYEEYSSDYEIEELSFAMNIIESKTGQRGRIVDITSDKVRFRLDEDDEEDVSYEHFLKKFQVLEKDLQNVRKWTDKFTLDMVETHMNFLELDTNTVWNVVSLIENEDGEVEIGIFCKDNNKDRKKISGTTLLEKYKVSTASLKVKLDNIYSGLSYEDIRNPLLWTKKCKTEDFKHGHVRGKDNLGGRAHIQFKDDNLKVENITESRIKNYHTFSNLLDKYSLLKEDMSDDIGMFSTHVEDIENEDLWEDYNNIKNIKTLVRVKKGDNIGIVRYNKDSIKILRKTGMTEFEEGDVVFKPDLGKYYSGLEYHEVINDELWLDVGSVSYKDIKIGTRVKDIYNNVWIVSSIKNGEINMLCKGDGRAICEADYIFLDDINGLSQGQDFFLNIPLADKIDPSKWLGDFPREHLKEHQRIKNKSNNRIGLLFKNLYEICYEDGTTEILEEDDIMLYIDDLPNIVNWIPYKDINNEDLWEFNYDKENIEYGMRFKDRRKAEGEYEYVEVIHVGEEEVTVRTNRRKVEVIKRNLFEHNYDKFIESKTSSL